MDVKKQLIDVFETKNFQKLDCNARDREIIILEKYCRVFRGIWCERRD